MYFTNCAQYEYGMQQVIFYFGLSVLLIPWKDSVLLSQFFIHTNLIYLEIKSIIFS